MKIIPLVLVLFAAVPNVIYGEINENAGSTALSWMKFGVGARPSGMGDVYVGVGDDAAAVFWNPACLAKSSKKSVMLMSSKWFEDIQYNAFAFAMPSLDEMWEPNRAIGLGALMVDLGWVQQTPETGWVLGEETTRFKPEASMFVFSFSQRLERSITLGLSAKMVTEKLYNETNTAYCGDVGIVFRGGTEYSNFSMGVVAQNIGGTVYNGSLLPQVVKAGIGLNADTIAIGCDVSLPSDHGLIASVGAEFAVAGILAVRGGYTVGYEEDMLGTSVLSGMPPGISLGCGIKTDNACIDIAYVPFGSLGDIMKGSVTLKF